MTSDQKIAYLGQFVDLVKAAKDYDSAIRHCTFTRGLLAAWYADLTISHESYDSIYNELQGIIDEKRELPVIKEEPEF